MNGPPHAAADALISRPGSTTRRRRTRTSVDCVCLSDANDPKWRAVDKSIPNRQPKPADAESVDLDALQPDRAQPPISTTNPLRNSDHFEPSPEVSIGMEDMVGDPKAGSGVIEANGDEDEWDVIIEEMTDDSRSCRHGECSH